MLYIDKLNDQPKQSYTLVGENREQIGFYLYFNPSQQLWNYDISYGDFVTRGLQLTVSPNCLRNYKNLIPFGLACTSIDGQDPFYLTDFALRRIQLFLLSSADVEAIEQSYFT